MVELTDNDVVRVIEAERKAERERCAKIAEEKAAALRSGEHLVLAAGSYDPQSLPFIYASMAMIADDIAAGIRNEE